MKTTDQTIPQRKRLSLWLLIPGGLIGLMVLAYAVMALLFAVYFFPAPTGQVVPGVYAVQDGIANLFLITDGETWIAIDAAQHRKAVITEMRKLKINPDRVSAVLLTHSDYDHTGGLTALPNAEIYISKKEEPFVTHKAQRKPGLYNNPLPRAYTLLHDGETLTFGGIKVHAVATPGHTLGSTSYIINDEMIFTGDTLVLTREGRVRLSYKIHNMDNETERASIHKLARLKGHRWVFSAHTGYSDDSAGAFRGW